MEHEPDHPEGEEGQRGGPQHPPGGGRLARACVGTRSMGRQRFSGHAVSSVAARVGLSNTREPARVGIIRAIHERRGAGGGGEMEASATRSVAGPELPPVEHTIADIAARAAASFGDATAVRHKVAEGEWREVTYEEVADDRARDRPRPDRPRSRARRPGLHPRRHLPRVDLRLLRGLCRWRGRRPDLPDQLPQGVRVGRRQLGRGGGDLRERRPDRQARGGARRPPGPPSSGRLRRRRDHPGGAARARSRRRRGRAVAGAPRGPKLDDPCVFIYTSGTTGPPKGCVLTHLNSPRWGR